MLNNLKRLIIIGIALLLITSLVVAQKKVKLDKDVEDKVKEFLGIDLKNKSITVNGVEAEQGILILDTTVGETKIKVITTNRAMDNKIKKNNSNSTKTKEIKEE